MIRTFICDWISNINTKDNTVATLNQHRSAFKLGSWELPSGEILAPMAGITDSPFRRIARRFGAGLLYTECISAEGVRRMGRESLSLARFEPEERPIAVQLFGSDADQFADAATVIAERVQPDAIDINCGCPVKKFVTRNCGGWLMQHPDLIGRIVETVRQATSLPVTVKLRAGYRAPDETAPEAAATAEGAGAALVAVHGRYVRGGARGSRADWEVIGRVKAAVSRIPVVGNGDVSSYEDAAQLRRETGCDRVMIARWAQGRPWIFAGFQPFSNGGSVREPNPAEKIELLLEHYQSALNWYPERRAVNLMRKHVGWYLTGLPGAGRVRAQVMKLSVASNAIEELEAYQRGLRDAKIVILAPRYAS